jgi:phosphinothricin acetyltransferase
LEKFEIRDAAERDIEAITAIYNDAVLHTTAIWNDTTVDPANRRVWLAERRRQNYPVLVAVTPNDKVLGYASFGDWRSFDGFRHTVENSVYIGVESRGAGIGEALMRVLIARARSLGKHAMVAGIEANNQASMRLHEKLGFSKAAFFPEVGVKFGQWLDLVFLHFKLDARKTPGQF